jgi:hypothetical protein
MIIPSFSTHSDPNIALLDMIDPDNVSYNPFKPLDFSAVTTGIHSSSLLISRNKNWNVKRGVSRRFTMNKKLVWINQFLSGFGMSGKPVPFIQRV